MSNLCRKSLALLLACALGVSMAGCNIEKGTGGSSTSSVATETANAPTANDININETIENTVDGEHVIQADGTEENYSHINVKKSGDSQQGDEADFYGENSAVFATNGATLNLSDILLETNGTHANGIFSYGEGTTVNVSDSVIETSGNCSGGLMTTGGGTMNASNLSIHTTGNSSAAIRSDRGGGTVTVNGGKYTTDGIGSPVIYSTADITVSDATMESTASQGAVVEGKNSVTLNNVDLTANNNMKNSDKSDYYQAVMIYQSMSGDASEGQGSFTMNGGTLTNQNGDIFFINNTTAQIELNDASITNNDSNGVFLRAAAAGWGNEGSNGGQVELTASSQDINGNLMVDAVSNLNLSLKNESTLTGAINPDGQEGGVYVELDENSTWTLTEDSYITGLTCDEDAIQLNGHKLYINGTEYTENTASTGDAIDLTTVTGSGQGQNQSGQQPPAKPDGANNFEHQLPTKPDDNSDSDHQPPAKPDGDNDSGQQPPSKPNSSGSDNTSSENTSSNT